MRVLSMKSLVLVLSIAGGLALFNVDRVDAASGSCYYDANGSAGGTGTCSVSGLGNYGTNDVFSGRSSSGNGNAVGFHVKNKSTFITYMKNRYNSGGKNRAAAAMIINRMMGRSPSRTVSAAVMAEWENLMGQGSVSYNDHKNNKQSVTTSSWHVSTGGQPNFFFDSRSKTSRYVIDIRQGGKLLLRLQRECGNPTALPSAFGWEPVPQTQFRVRTSSSAAWPSTWQPGAGTGAPVTVRAGYQVQWRHRVMSEGKGVTNKRVYAQVSSNGASGNRGSGVTVGDRILPSSLSWYRQPGTTAQPELAVTITAAHATNNQLICRYIAGWKKDEAKRYSNQGCVRAVDPNANLWNLAPRISMRQSGGAALGNNAKVSAGEVIDVIPRVVNSGGERSDNRGVWQVMGFQLSSGNGRGGSPVDYGASGGLNSTNMCLYYGGGSVAATGCYTPRHYSEMISPGVGRYAKSRGYFYQNTGTTSAGAIGNAFVKNCNPTTYGSRLACLNEWRSSTLDYYRATIPASATPGQKYCFGMAVNRWHGTTQEVNSTAPWHNHGRYVRYATAQCVQVAGKRPRIQVEGSDVTVGGTINTAIVNSVSPASGRFFGSWTEYGVYSYEGNYGMSSGSGLRSTTTTPYGGSTNSAQTAWSKLTFANTTTTPPLVHGNFSGVPHTSDIAEYFARRAPATPNYSSGTMNLSSTDSGIYKTPASADPNIPANINIFGNIGNKKIVVIVNGTATINGNIINNGSGITRLRDIPQLVIIANDIRIAPSVTRVDAWLISRGWLLTCYNSDNFGIPYSTDLEDIIDGGDIDGVIDPTDDEEVVEEEDVGGDYAAGKLSTGVCNDPLTINGPVSAQKIYLYRTAGAGSGNTNNTYAETFNHRGDAYLWGYNFSQSRSAITTSSIKELPPRF